VLSERNSLYLVVMTEPDAKVRSDDNTLYTSVAKQESIKDGSELGDA